jgi:hypothetical protein
VIRVQGPVIRVQIRALPGDRILLQVGDQWWLVMRTESAATLGAMLLDAAYPDDPTAVPDTYTIDVTTN